MNDILHEIEALLGPVARLEPQRGWGVWWCPFHGDADRRGRGGRPNFGVQLQSGYWKCLRCGASGPSLAALRQQLGLKQTAAGPVLPATRSQSSSPVERLNEALAEARAALPDTPGSTYLASRGVTNQTALCYGLGYGLPNPQVHLETIQAARVARLVGTDGVWLWAGGIVYADPPVNPQAIQVRHLRPQTGKKYQTWGRLSTPLGAWRLAPATRTIILVEGLFDLLILAQLLETATTGEIIPLYTGGSSASYAMREWLRMHPYQYLLLPDGDPAGRCWTRALTSAIERGSGQVQVAPPPDGLDPDQAILAGWRPPGL